VITHEQEQKRFSILVDNILCVLDYSLDAKVMTIEHTRVPPAVGGRGIAADLTKAAFDYARAQGLKIIPACRYAAVWAKRHPEAEALLQT
jgi:uncharacterized protein